MSSEAVGDHQEDLTGARPLLPSLFRFDFLSPASLVNLLLWVRKRHPVCERSGTQVTLVSIKAASERAHQGERRSRLSPTQKLLAFIITS